MVEENDGGSSAASKWQCILNEWLRLSEILAANCDLQDAG